MLRSTLLVLLFALGAHADLPGVGDPPRMPRVAGSEIVGHASVPFDSGSFLREAADGSVERTQVEGSHTRVLYLNKPGDSPLMVQKNYETALAELGTVTELHACRGDCSNHVLATTLWTADNLVEIPSLPHDLYLLGFGHVFGKAAYRYARVETADAHLHVGVLSTVLADNNANVSVRGRTVTLLDVVQVEAFEATLEFIDAGEMRSRLGDRGHVALYGIQFDHDSATLRADSTATLDEIVEVLRSDPSLAIYVVGHTDDAGALAYNQELSLRRARSVVKRLQDAGIAATRLTALGVGPAAPLGSNETDEGRARNRRVELVKRR